MHAAAVEPFLVGDCRMQRGMRWGMMNLTNDARRECLPLHREWAGRMNAVLVAVLALVGGGISMAEATSARGLHSAEEIAIAKENVARYDWAREELDRTRQRAAKWAAMPETELRALVTPPEVPRAFRVHENGCPVHGQEVYRHGGYPWIMSLDEPWKVKCPVGGESYPSNDFGAYLQSGLKDRSLLTGPYADDGWGWRNGEEGAKYWFIAHYNHYAIWNGIRDGLSALGRAYLLTDDPVYARKAAALLLQIAEYYPRYDHGPQSRYGTEIDRRYSGKIVNRIWETGMVTAFAAAYDAISPALAPEERRKIEIDILRDAAHHVMVTGKVRGNFGMHQTTLLTIALALKETTGAPTREEMVRWVLEGTGSGVTLNVRDALHNLVFRDGVPQESPGYNLGWVSNLTATAKLLKRAGTDLFREPKFRRLYDWPIDIALLGRITPALGDTGSMFPGLTRWSPDLYLTAFREYDDPRFAAVVARGGEIRVRDLFARPLDDEVRRAAAASEAPGTRSRLFPGYGFATLQTTDPRAVPGTEARATTGPVAITLSFPQYHGHRHHDFLDLGLYAMGKALIPDFGYPETASADDPRRPGFFGHAVSHNTVLIDARDQASHAPYVLHAYDVTPVLQRVDVSAPGIYPGTARVYRRSVAMAPLEDGSAYAVDFFHVAGGRQHDWVVHGSETEFRSEGLRLPAPSPDRRCRTVSSMTSRACRTYRKAPAMAATGAAGSSS